jgi:hypothetical protein
MRDPTPKNPSGGRYPGYDVLTKRDSPSWNAKTREVIAHRLAIGSQPKFFTADEFLTVKAITERIVPQPQDRLPIPVAGLVDDRLHSGKSDGFRRAGMPHECEAWRTALHALDAEAKDAYGKRFHGLAASEQDTLLALMENGELRSAAWNGLSADKLFKHRIARDIVYAYYAHPSAWSEIGWGGPASPRGYVRMDFDERDPWEAAEVKDGDVEQARRDNRRV